VNYSDLIRRTTSEVNGTKCRHGLDASFCGYCNGQSAVKRAVYKEEVVSDELLAQYERLKEKFRNYNDIWTEDEFFVVYANIKDIIGTRLEKRAIYQTAMELSRTIGAINWAKEHLFSKKDYHRGKTVVEFRKLFGLDKNE